MVDAFSAPRWLIDLAKKRAAELRWTKTGFYRYCLAKELGMSEADARELALHGAIQALRDAVAKPAARKFASYQAKQLEPAMLNDAPANSSAVENLRVAKGVEALWDENTVHTPHKHGSAAPGSPSPPPARVSRKAKAAE
jgi:hypothetical protein